MSYRLLFFPTPLDAHCELRHDSGLIIGGVAAVHPSGRLGQAFMIPDGTPNGHGAKLLITAPKKVPLEQRGIVYLNDGQLLYPWSDGQTAAFAADDFALADAPSGLPKLAIEGKFLVQAVP